MLESILNIPNVISAQKLEKKLSVQLSFCAIADGFMGMASGICNSAFLSKKPCVVFKHPLHHIEEMKIEVGIKDYLPFSLESQKLWRKKDNLENLRCAMRFINKW